MSSTQSIWKSTEKMLLVVNYVTVEELQKFREAIKEMGLNIHQCKILAVVESKKEKILLREVSSVTYCSPQELNLLGKLKNEDAVKLFSDKFDTITIIGDLNKKISKLIKKMAPKNAVGVNSNVEFLTINMTSKSSSPAQLLNFVKQTLEKIQ